ncbi:MAG: hypothetical protein AABW51_03560 [Nanoarchaeota archaeon]
MNNVHKSLIKLMKERRVPCSNIGVINDKVGKPRFLEVIIKRPDRYNFPELLKKVPKKFEGLKVKVF